MPDYFTPPKSVVAVEVGGFHGLGLFPVPPLAHLALPLEVLLEVVPLRTVARRQHAGVQPLWKKQKLLLKIHTAVSREAWATLPESSSRPLPATLAQTRNLAHASLETAEH